MNKLLELRKKYNVSQTKLSSHLGISRLKILRAEKGQLTVETAKVLGQYFHVDWSVFFDQNVHKMY